MEALLGLLSSPPHQEADNMKTVKTTPYLYRRITNEKQINTARNAMVADGHFGAGMSDCFVVGINGNCGPDCPVYLISKECAFSEEEKNGTHMP
jgi:hypothetical protein